MTMATAILFMGGLALLIAAGLAFAASRLDDNADAAVERIHRLLPHTQCGQCGFPGCRPYAEALADGTTALNRCPPGGEATIHALSRLLDRPALPPDPQYGAFGVAAVAVIDEDACIGCALCLQACPVDAILGAPQWMHTVIEAECTGCELCIAPCPVDCIALVPPSRETCARTDESKQRI